MVILFKKAKTSLRTRSAEPLNSNGDATMGAAIKINIL